jgi:hypothetical protein
MDWRVVLILLLPVLVAAVCCLRSFWDKYETGGDE